MDEPDKNVLREMRQTFKAADSVPVDRLVPVAGKTHRSKVFKSGNSLALRLPKALGLEAGIEMEVEVMANGALELRRAASVKCKFDIDKVWGSATNLKPIDEDDRWFEERELDWGDAGDGRSA